MLPEEIILNILSRLPPKSIGRFRCVSKPWRSLLSQPLFIKSHLQQTHHFSTLDQISLLLFSHESTSLYSIHLTNYPTNLSPHIPAFATHLTLDDHCFSSTLVNVDTMAPCDGVILLKNEQHKLLLLNPTTKVVQVLPTSPFALDPSVSLTLEGFGYDYVSDDYKVVTLSYYDAYYYEDYNDDDPNCTDVFVNVFSVKNGAWKRCGSSPYDHAVGYPTGVFVKGRIHWLASKGVHNSVIAGFDLGEERFYEVEPPSSVDVEKFVFDRLVELGGCLSMFNSSDNGGTDVWVMKEYGVGESWSKFTVSDDERSEFRPVCLLGKEQVVVLQDMDDDFLAEKLVVFNLKEETFRDLELDGVSGGFCVGGAFKESLVSPLIVDLQQ